MAPKTATSVDRHVHFSRGRTPSWRGSNSCTLVELVNPPLLPFIIISPHTLALHQQYLQIQLKGLYDLGESLLSLKWSVVLTNQKFAVHFPRQHGTTQAIEILPYELYKPHLHRQREKIWPFTTFGTQGIRVFAVNAGTIAVDKMDEVIIAGSNLKNLRYLITVSLDGIYIWRRCSPL